MWGGGTSEVWSTAAAVVDPLLTLNITPTANYQQPPAPTPNPLPPTETNPTQLAQQRHQGHLGQRPPPPRPQCLPPAPAVGRPAGRPLGAPALRALLHPLLREGARQPARWAGRLVLASICGGRLRSNCAAIASAGGLMAEHLAPSSPSQPPPSTLNPQPQVTPSTTPPRTSPTPASRPQSTGSAP